MLNQKIKKLREQSGLTQEELGRRIQVSGTYVSQVETGLVTNLTLDSLKKFARYFNVTIGYLLDEELDDGELKFLLVRASQLDGSKQKLAKSLMRAVINMNKENEGE